MKGKLEGLERDYRDFDISNLGFPLSSRLLNPVLRIERVDSKFSASLGSNIIRSGSEVFLPCLSLSHNWLFDGARIKPLPHDCPEVVANAMSGQTPSDLTFPQVLRLLREGIDGIEVSVAAEVLEKANSRSMHVALPKAVEGLNATLYPYQERGVAWLLDALESIGGAILADEMGLGKTLQIIALILLKEPSKESPALIVCPTTLIANWHREIHRFGPSLSVQIHRGAERTGYYRDLMKSEVVITTYDTLVNDVALFRGVDWTYLICDEAQALKNPESKRRFAASSLSRKYAIPVTGTPVENTLLDLWSLADIAVPGIFGSKEEFSATYPDSEEGALELGESSDTIVLKRQVKDVANDLPERTDIDLPLEMDAKLSRSYCQTRDSVISEYGRAGRLVAVGQLAIHCAHPWLRATVTSEDPWVEEAELSEDLNHALLTPKMELCAQLLKESAQNGKKVLVFVTYNRCGDLIRRAANVIGVGFNYWNSINGSTPQPERQAIVDEFSSSNGAAVLVLNPRAAGAGLNITAATVVIHYTPNWNPALEMQASARAHRRGQEDPVTVYRLFYLGTVEETMIERSQWKRELGNSAIPISTRDTNDLDKALSVEP